MRDTCNIKVAQSKFIKESYVKTEELCWWHPHFQTLECHLHLPEHGLRWKKTRKPQLNDAGVELRKRHGLTAKSFWDSPALVSSLEPNHSTKTGDTMSLNQGSNLWDVPKLHIFGRMTGTPHSTLRGRRVALVEGYSCVHQNNIATNPHATLIARTPLELTIKLSNTAAANLNPLELDMFEITRHDSLMADNADGCASTFPGGISDGEIAPVQCKIFVDVHSTCSKKLVSVQTWLPP